jgi:hypothetical protein
MIPVDAAVLILWLALLIKNTAAVMPLFILAINATLFHFIDSGFVLHCITAALCFTLAQTNYNIPLKLRYALLASGCVYWVGALDELLYNHLVSCQGVYYDVMPYLVLSLNAYIAAVISLDTGGRSFVGIADKLRNLVNGRIIRL